MTTGSDWKSGRPWRRNVGICLFNRQGLVWVGKSTSSGPELVTPGRDWQMPQGGIDADEDILVAARRELREETGALSVELCGVTSDWWRYDFPVPSPDPGHKLAAFRGQMQKWVAFRFTGPEQEFDTSASHTDQPQEFGEWTWVEIHRLPDLVVEFKREQYQRVVEAFGHFASPWVAGRPRQT